MNIIERVKGILLTPKTEWAIIDNEPATPPSVLTSYVIPMVIVSMVGTLIRYFAFSSIYSGTTYLIATLIVAFLAAILGYYISTYVIDTLAPSFGSEKNLGKSAQLVAYSGTPGYIAGLLSFIPVIGPLLGFAAWIYGIYLMYIGIGPLKKTPEDKKVVYLILSYVVIIAVYFILMAVLGLVIFGMFGLGAMSLGLGR